MLGHQVCMSPRKSAELYFDHELLAMKEKWLSDKQRIDADPNTRYYYDQDKEYERHLNNAGLRALFRHAAYLFRGLKENTVFLYPGEAPVVTDVYRKIIRDGYYSKFKTEEKNKRAWLGKAVSRQYFRARHGR